MKAWGVTEGRTNFAAWNATEAAYHKGKKREEIPVMPMEAPGDWCMFKCIEVALVVAWSLSAELFFMQIMQGDEEFCFMIPGNEEFSVSVTLILLLSVCILILHDIISIHLLLYGEYDRTQIK